MIARRGRAPQIEGRALRSGAEDPVSFDRIANQVAVLSSGSSDVRPASGEGQAGVAPVRASERVILAAIVLIGLLLRLPSFGDSLFGDEVGAYWIVNGHSLGRV